MAREFQLAGRLAAWVAVVMLGVLSIVPGEWRPHTVMPGRMEHFAAYGLTGVAIAVGYARASIRIYWWFALTAAAATFEVVQAFVPQRSPSPYDALASSVGLATGLVLAGALMRLTQDRLPNGIVGLTGRNRPR
jgi:hypothetical protein